MPFANNGGNFHGSVDVGPQQCLTPCLPACLPACHVGKRRRGRLEALGASYMRDCFRAQAFETTYIDSWTSPSQLQSFKTTASLLKEDVSNFMQSSPKGVLLVHVDEHRCMCPDPNFRRGALGVLAELPGVHVLATYTDLPPLPALRSSGTCRRPIPCMLPDVKTIMDLRLRMGEVYMKDEAVLLRVATLRVTLGLAPEAAPC